MKCFWLALALAMTIAGRVGASPLRVVVRDGGEDGVTVARLRGQLADLPVRVTVERGAIEPALGLQLAEAARLAEADQARAIVWFVAHEGGVVVAVATPDDRRLFVREIPPADASAVAEAAAVAARGAIRAIAEGGTIGVEISVPPHVVLELSLGWQAALDDGARVGAEALAVRASLVRGPWAFGLALTLGPALRDPAPDVTLALSRSSAGIVVERRFGGLAVGASVGGLVYHRSTVATTGELAATPDAFTFGFAAGPELGWRWRSRGGVGVDATIGVDVVAGAPDLAVSRDAMVSSVGQLRVIQPRFALSVVGLP